MLYLYFKNFVHNVYLENSIIILFLIHLNQIKAIFSQNLKHRPGNNILKNLL
jgi:hypothetical protein